MPKRLAGEPLVSRTDLLRSRRFWVGFAAATVFLFALKYLPTLSEQLTTASATYDRLLTSKGFRSLYPRNTAVIEIAYGVEPQDVTLVNVCQQRLFLSRLLTALVTDKARPAAIVIDKFFSPDACHQTTACPPAAGCDGTPSLQAAIAGLLEKNMTIVVGRRINNATSAIDPSLAFPAGAGGQRVTEAALTLDADERRVALIWRDLLDEHQNKVELETLALKGARAKTPNLEKVNGRFNWFYRQAGGPFIGFLPASAFDEYVFSAIEVLCGKGATAQTDWRHCSTPNAPAIQSLSGRIVLIGENYVGVDQHTTIIGTVPGVRLQANYIEAILDDDLFRPVPEWAGLAYGFLVFAIIELASFALKSWKKWGLIAGVTTGAYIVSYAVVWLTGYYLNPGLGIIGGVFSQLGHAVAKQLNPPAKDAV
jgi:CHASE2 domain-containing sensor protein